MTRTRLLLTLLLCPFLLGAENCFSPEESCYVDRDNDGTRDCTDCDPADPLRSRSDADRDGYNTCDEPLDCNDANKEIYPDAPEYCDGKDTSCAGRIPRDEQDRDHDGYVPCSPWIGYHIGVGVGSDCNDTDAHIRPGSYEYDCTDGLDNNCNGQTDGEDPECTDVCFDHDGDGSWFCGVDGNEWDCNDFDATIYPGAPDVCDGRDNDCDPSTYSLDAEFGDFDADGFFRCNGDCDLGRADVYPGAPEVCDNRDNDCDGTADNDAIGSGSFCLVDDLINGFLDCEGVRVCAATDPAYALFELTCWPTYSAELCDSIDNDCDGDTDEACEGVVTD